MCYAVEALHISEIEACVGHLPVSYSWENPNYGFQEVLVTLTWR